MHYLYRGEKRVSKTGSDGNICPTSVCLCESKHGTKDICMVLFQLEYDKTKRTCLLRNKVTFSLSFMHISIINHVI